MELKCKKCDYSLTDDAVFCSNCGEKVVRESYCTQCHKVLPPESKFCGFCGCSVGAIPPEIQVPPVSSKPVIEQEVPSKPLVSTDTSTMVSYFEPPSARQSPKASDSQMKQVIIAAIVLLVTVVLCFSIPALLNSGGSSSNYSQTQAEQIETDNIAPEFDVSAPIDDTQEELSRLGIEESDIPTLFEEITQAVVILQQSYSPELSKAITGRIDELSELYTLYPEYASALNLDDIEGTIAQCDLIYDAEINWWSARSNSIPVEAIRSGLASNSARTEEVYEGMLVYAQIQITDIETGFWSDSYSTISGDLVGYSNVDISASYVDTSDVLNYNVGDIICVYGEISSFYEGFFDTLNLTIKDSRLTRTVWSSSSSTSIDVSDYFTQLASSTTTENDVQADVVETAPYNNAEEFVGTWHLTGMAMYVINFSFDYATGVLSASIISTDEAWCYAQLKVNWQDIVFDGEYYYINVSGWNFEIEPVDISITMRGDYGLDLDMGSIDWDGHYWKG